MERDRYGYAFKYFVTKEFKESMAYINNYCAQVVQTRQRESTEQLTARTDLLSKMLLAGKVGGGLRTLAFVNRNYPFIRGCAVYSLQ
jgi:hypothetical protein